MITDIVLQAQPRTEKGKNASRRLRAAGRLPVAVYGEGLPAIPVSINIRELGAILRSESGRNAIFTLAIEGHDSSPVKIGTLELDPVSNRLVHADMVRISMTETTRVSVPLEFVGEPVAVKRDGAMFEVHLHAIEIESLPRDIPANIPVDVSGLEVGQQVSVGDISVDEGITVVTDPDHLVAVVNPPRLAEEEPEAPEPAAEPAAEPEA